jgi:ABC-type uncharacterized transport system auxiliary subunit
VSRVEARRAAALVAGLAAGLWACAGSPPPADVFHRLEVVPLAARSVPLLSGTVMVTRLDASDVLRGRAIVVAHADRPGRLQRSSYQFWVDAPAVLLQEALASYLRRAGLAERVVVPERRDRVGWIVSGRVERFERVIGAGGDRVSVSIELALRRPDERQLRVQGVYELTEPASGGTPEAAVDAFGRAVGRVFAAFVADVEAALRAGSPGGSD